MYDTRDIRMRNEKMKNIQKLLKDKCNIAILGTPDSGTSVLLKNILIELVSANKKVLMLENVKEKSEKLTTYLGGSYITYPALNRINFNNKLTTVAVNYDINSNGNEDIQLENILNIIGEAEKAGVEIILIDKAWICIENCNKLIDKVHTQLIVCSAFYKSIIIEEDTPNFNENAINFKHLFNTVIIMGAGSYLNSIYGKIATLYNIEFDPSLLGKNCFEGIVIQNKKIIEENLKVSLIY